MNPRSGTFEYTYNSFGQLAKVDYPNNLDADYNYDEDTYRLSRSGVFVPAAGWYHLGAYYHYDENGNLSHTAWFNGEEEPLYDKYYTYDALNQLKSEKRVDVSGPAYTYMYDYDYDPVGNREQMVNFNGTSTVTTTYAYDAANRLTSRDEGGTATNYFFDANGNMTSEEEEHDTNRNFTWNRDDRMVQVSNEFAAGAPVVSYVYDAMGRRIVRKKGAEWRMFYYDGLSVAAEKKSTNSGGAWAWDRLYTLAPGVIGHVLAQSQWSGAAWVSTFLHYDHIGNVTLSTNAGGSPIDSYDQDAFGNPLQGPDSGLRLQTKELDADAGLYYFYQRWYDLEFSLFTSKSPLPIKDEHQYVFVRNNSLKLIDPLGLIEGDKECKCEEAVERIGKVYESGIFCMKQCKTECMSAPQNISVGWQVRNCLIMCRKGGECADAWKELAMCWEKSAGNPKSVAKCWSDVKDIIEKCQKD